MADQIKKLVENSTGVTLSPKEATASPRQHHMLGRSVMQRTYLTLDGNRDQTSIYDNEYVHVESHPRDKDLMKRLK